MKTKLTADQYREKIFNDPSTHFLVLEIIKTLEERDPCDALNNLDIIVEYFDLRYQEILENLKST